MLKISLLFKKLTNFTGSTREFLELGMRNSQGLVFLSTQLYREILKAALVYCQDGERSKFFKLCRLQMS